MLDRRGFSLLELIIAMTVATIVILSASKLWIHLQAKLLYEYHFYQLREELHQLMMSMSKDIKRAGFIANPDFSYKTPYFYFDRQQRCLLIIYDIDLKGDIDAYSGNHLSHLGYRLYSGAIEYQRGVTHCFGNGWEKISDPAAIVITEFKVEQRDNYYYLYLVANTVRHPAIRASISYLVRRETH